MKTAARAGLWVGSATGLVLWPVELTHVWSLLPQPLERLLFAAQLLVVLGCACSVFGVLLFVTGAWLTRRASERRWLFDLYVTALASPAAWALSVLVFSGGSMSDLSLRPLLTVLVFSVLVASAFGATRLARVLVERIRSRAVPDALLAAIGAVLAASIGLSYWADATLYRRLYAYLHAALSVATVLGVGLLVALGAVRFAPRWRPSSRATTALAGALLAAALLTRLTFGLNQDARYAAYEATAIERNVLVLVRGVVGSPEVHPRRRAATRPAPAPSRDGSLPVLAGANLVLITIDALRADRLGAYGYRRRPTPRFDALGRQGVLFERAYAPVPHSSFSISSLHTGTPLHAVISMAEPEADETGRERVARRPTLADVLRAQGYLTAAFYTSGIFHTDGDRLNVYNDSRFGFESADRVSRLGPEMTDRVIQQLDEIVARGEPKFFVWAHYFDPHEPYLPATYGASPSDRYDGEIAIVDREISRLVDHLRRALDRPTIVVVTADHGEEFREHGGAYHGSSLYDEQIRVPLLLLVPGLDPQRVAAPVGLVDVAPTLLRLVGVDPPATMRGGDLRLLWHGTPVDRPSPVFATVMQKKMVLSWPFKLICDLRYNIFELYDLAHDPGETTNLYDRDRRTARRLLGEVYAWLDQLRIEHSGDPGDPRLRALALARVGDRRAAEPLRSLVLDPAADAPTRAEAARMLGAIDDWDAVPALSSAMRDGSPLVTLHAAASLARFGQQAAREFLAPFLYSEERTERILAARGLGLLGDRRAVSGLLEALGAEDLEVRREAIKRLGELGDARAVEPLLELLAEYRTRYLVAQALGLIGDRRAVAPLHDLLSIDDHTDVRTHIVQALGRIGDARVLETVVRIARDEPEVTTGAESAIRLGAIGRGLAFGTDAAPGRPALGEGVSDCRRVEPRRPYEYRQETTCAVAGRSGRLTIVLPDPAPQAAVGLLGVRAEDRGPRAVRVLWNGREVLNGGLRPAWQDLRFSLDRAALRPGANPVELLFSGAAGADAPVARIDHLLVLPR